MKFLFILIFFFVISTMNAQLGFCSGSKGDPIFHEDFGPGTGTGEALPAGITTYTFVKVDPQDGEYTIAGHIGSEINSWHSVLPETSISGGRALIVNADVTAGRFYRKEISGLCENTTYEFSAFLMNVYDRSSNVCENGGIPNNVRFEIWDETDTILIKSGDTPSIASTATPEWNQFALTFKSEPGQGAVILKMFNNGDGGCGNDLAIDDIIFRACGDLTTISTAGAESDGLNICEEDTPRRVNLKANADGSVYTQRYYQWQISLNGEDWGDIPGAESEIYETSMIYDSVFYRVKVAENKANLAGSFCSAASEAFHIQVISSPDPPKSDGDLTVCQNDPAPALRVAVEDDETVNWYDSETGGNLLAEGTNTYFPIESGTYYAEAILKDSNCTASSRTGVKLTINRLPVLTDAELKICPQTSIVLEAGVSGYDYRWSTGETLETIIITAPGEYTVDIISAENCFTTRSFKVESLASAAIAEVISLEEYIEIIPKTEGDFQFSIDGLNYQVSPVFSSIPGGIYTAYIADAEFCQVDSLEFAHIVVPSMITPNNDGFNDYFQLKGVEFFAISEIQIFNRYGKLLKLASGAGFKWDGTWNGTALPADDYWYRIKIVGFKDRTGHFSLVR